MTARVLSKDEARRIIVRAQLLDADRPGDVVEVAEQLGYIKIDPTAVIAPCEHTVLWSRIGWSYEATQLRKAVEDDRLLFEFDGAFRPVSLLPLMLPDMRTWPRRESSRQWLDANAKFRADILARLRSEGPLLTSDIPDTAQVDRAPDGWYGRNQVPHMLDFLTRQGEVAIIGREDATAAGTSQSASTPPTCPSTARRRRPSSSRNAGFRPQASRSRTRRGRARAWRASP
nr:hypothetical protein GCM10025699_00190 [Microbacterium flavescens]